MGWSVSYGKTVPISEYNNLSASYTEKRLECERLIRAMNAQKLERDELKETLNSVRHNAVQMQLKHLDSKQGDLYHAMQFISSLTSDVMRGAATTQVAKERDELAAMVGRLREALHYGCDYLDEGKLNSIGHGSKAHREMRSALEETPPAALAELNAEAFDAPAIHPRMKAGCAGEFTVPVAYNCPECWHEQKDPCHLCGGKADEDGGYEGVVDVPWTTQKEIFKAMCKFKAQQIREGKA